MGVGEGVCASGRCLTGSLPICSWRFAFYLCSFLGGLWVLYHVSSPAPHPPTSTYYVPGLDGVVGRGAGRGDMCKGTERGEATR